MIQDIRPEIFRNEYTKKRTAKPDDTVFVFQGSKILAAENSDSTISFPKASELNDIPYDLPDMPAVFLQYLFEIDGHGFYLWMCEDPAVSAPDADVPGLTEAYSYISIRYLRKAGPKDLAFAAATAYQLYGWYRDNRYCGRCGHLMQIGQAERNMLCPTCGNTVYPKIMPAVIVGVLNPAKNAILMTRYAGRAYKGHALIAGFCEIGETGEDTVRREVMEEAGIRVKNIRYYKTQPWGFDSDLLLGYYCEVDGDDTIHMEEDELSAAVWVPKNEIDDKPEDMSLTNEMIIRFRDGKIVF